MYRRLTLSNSEKITVLEQNPTPLNQISHLYGVKALTVQGFHQFPKKLLRNG
jgi:hypothetical protein